MITDFTKLLQPGCECFIEKFYFFTLAEKWQTLPDLTKGEQEFLENIFLEVKKRYKEEYYHTLFHILTCSSCIAQAPGILEESTHSSLWKLSSKPSIGEYENIKKEMQEKGATPKALSYLDILYTHLVKSNLASENLPPINEIVRLLHDYSHQTLQMIRKKYPQYSQELKLGITAGETDYDNLFFRAEVCLNGLKETIKLQEKKICILKNEIKKRKKILFSLQPIMAVGYCIYLFIYESKPDSINSFVILVSCFFIVVTISCLNCFLMHKYSCLLEYYNSIVVSKIESQQIIEEIDTLMTIKKSFIDKKTDEYVEVDLQIAKKRVTTLIGHGNAICKGVLHNLEK